MEILSHPKPEPFRLGIVGQERERIENGEVLGVFNVPLTDEQVIQAERDLIDKARAHFNGNLGEFRIIKNDIYGRVNGVAIEAWPQR